MASEWFGSAHGMTGGKTPSFTPPPLSGNFSYVVWNLEHAQRGDNVAVTDLTTAVNVLRRLIGTNNSSSKVPNTVLVLPETDMYTLRTAFTNQPKDIADALGMQYLFDPADSSHLTLRYQIPLLGGSKGLSMLIPKNWTILSRNVIQLGVDDDDRNHRSAIIAKVRDAEGREIALGAVHLGGQLPGNELQRVLNAVLALRADWSFVGGDCNTETWDLPDLGSFTRVPNNVPTRDGLAQPIDQCFWACSERATTKVTGWFVAARQAVSDHNPFRISFQLSDPPTPKFAPDSPLASNAFPARATSFEISGI